MGRAFEYRKAAKLKRWGHMAKTFTKIGKQIAIAVKAGGPEPDMNPALRACIANAKRENMPKDNIERAIKNAMGKDQSDYKEVTYEGYGPHGVAIFVETLTDNTTRTVGDVRSVFNKFNGNLGTQGSLSFLFDHKAVFTFKKKDGLDMDELILDLIDYGVEDEFDEDEETGEVTIYGDPSSFGAIQKHLEAEGFEVVTAIMNSTLYNISGDTFKMMDRNLGAVQATAASDDESVLTFGLFYQWGRKDPIPSYSTAKDDRTFAHTSRVARVKGTHTVAYSIQNPTTIVTYSSAAPWLGFASDKAANAPLWGAPLGTINTLTIKTVTKGASDYVKTVFDPCPTGYQVPQAYRFTGISNSTIPSPANNGHALLYDGANTAYYPLSGAISSTATTATQTQTGARNHILSATPYGTGGVYSLELQMVGSPSQVSGTSYCPQTMCGSVRCVKTSSL